MLEEMLERYSEMISNTSLFTFRREIKELEEQGDCSDEDYVALYNVWRSSIKSEFYQWLKMMTNYVRDEDLRVAFRDNRTLKYVLTTYYRGDPEDVDIESAFVRMEADVGGELFVYRQGALHFIDVDRSRMFSVYRFDLGRDFYSGPADPLHRKSDMRNNIRFDLQVATGYQSHNLSWFCGSQKLMRPRPARSSELVVTRVEGELRFFPESEADNTFCISNRADVCQDVISHVLEREDVFWSRILSNEESFYYYKETEEAEKKYYKERNEYTKQLEEELRLSRKKIEELEQLIALLRSDGFGSA